MPSYNFCKKADRERKIAENRDEIAAIDAGEWPRTTDEDLRFRAVMLCDAVGDRARKVRRILLDEIAYLESIPARHARGELPDFAWEI
jgi:hypothetical protein